MARPARGRRAGQRRQLVLLSERRVASDFNPYLVYPARTAGHPGFEAFRAWLHAQAA